MNSTEIIDAVRRVGQISTQDPVYTDATILAEASQALIDRFAEPVSTLRQGYGLHQSEVVTDVLANFVRIPPRAVVQGLEKVEVSDDAGESYSPLNILTQAQATVFSPTQTGAPSHYTLEGDTIRLFPFPRSTAFTIRFTYYLRSPELIAFADVCKVVSSFFTAITVTTNPATIGITTSTGIDIQNADGSHELAVVGAPVTSITGAGPFVINLDPDVPTGKVRAGDYVRLPGQAVYPMLPVELHRPLCDYVAAMIWASKGDKEKSGILSQKAENGINRVVSMAQPRNKTGQFSFRRNNSFLRRSQSSRWR